MILENTFNNPHHRTVMVKMEADSVPSVSLLCGSVTRSYSSYPCPSVLTPGPSSCLLNHLGQLQCEGGGMVLAVFHEGKDGLEGFVCPGPLACERQNRNLLETHHVTQMPACDSLAGPGVLSG